MQPMRRLNMDWGSTTFLFQVEGGVEGGVFCSRGGALLSKQVCMSLS